MRASGLGGTEVPIHIEDGGITNERSRSGRDIAHLKLVGFEGPWFYSAHFSHRPFTIARELGSRVRHSRSRLNPGRPTARAYVPKDQVATRLVTNPHSPDGGPAGYAAHVLRHRAIPRVLPYITSLVS